MGKSLHSYGRADTQNTSFTIVKNKALNRLSHFEIKRKVHQEIVDKYDSEFNNPDFYLSDELFRLYEEALKNFRKNISKLTR